MLRFADAEATLKEAADIERELVAQDPAAYRPLLGLSALSGHRYPTSWT
jgi:hypothetical protein